jgi:peptidoglycan/LPS O-acetylase OafA/YrhL
VRAIAPALFRRAETDRRFVSLDALRGVAILLILYGHVVFRMPDNAVARPLLLAVRQLGVVGVDLFYVLSGFLVGGALLAEQKSTGRVRIGRFFARRALRLWPSYLLVILFAWKWFHWVTVPLTDGSVAPGASFTSMWPYFLHVQNYYDLLRHDLGASAALQTWTLASIVHFYVFAALLIAGLSALGARAVRTIPAIVAIIAVGCFLLRLQAAPAGEEQFDTYRHYFPTHLRLDEPMFGLLCAYVVIHHRPGLEWFMRRVWPLVLLASAALLLPIALRRQETPRFLCVWGYTAGALAACGLALTFWWLEERRQTLGTFIITLLRPLAAIGLWSYSIHLWHQPLCTHLLEEKLRLFVGGHLIAWSSPLYYPIATAVYVVAAVGIGAMMYFVIERPSLLLRQIILETKAFRRGSTAQPQAITAAA